MLDSFTIIILPLSLAVKVYPKGVPLKVGVVIVLKAELKSVLAEVAAVPSPLTSVSAIVTAPVRPATLCTGDAPMRFATVTPLVVPCGEPVESSISVMGKMSPTAGVAPRLSSAEIRLFVAIIYFLLIEC